MEDTMLFDKDNIFDSIKFEDLKIGSYLFFDEHKCLEYTEDTNEENYTEITRVINGKKFYLKEKE